MSLLHTFQGHNSFILLKTVLLLSILNLSVTNSVCPDSAYVSISDASKYGSKICATVDANTPYRIEGGASLSCSGRYPSVISSDLSVLTKALCIKTTTIPDGSEIPVKMKLPPGCKANYIQATYQQALAYRYEICSRLNGWDIVSLQGGGSIRGLAYQCAVTATDRAGMGHIACVALSSIGSITIATVTIVDANEHVCSSCQSLITTTEASIYYTSIPVGTTARIAGGSSVQRTSESAFTILDHDTTPRSNQICASVSRAGCSISSNLTLSCPCEDLDQIPKVTGALSKTTNVGFTLGAVFSYEPTAVFTGLLFKQIGYIKYFDIAYPNNLELAFPKWQSDLIPSVFPKISQNTTNQLEAKPIPTVYLKRKLAPTFLQNFWFPMLNLVTTFFALGCIFLALIHCKQKGKQNAEVILKYLLIGLINFIVVQLYYHCGDILLFFILEARSIDFGSALSVFSFCISFVFLGLSFGALLLHSFILFKCSNAHHTKKTPQFEEKLSYFKILSEAFKNSSFLSSSYLLLFTLKDVTLNLIIALLFAHPLAQVILFLFICVASLIFLIIMWPFKRILKNIALCFFEALVLLTYIAALVTRCTDINAWKTKDRLGMLIIVMAFIFSLASTVFMLLTLRRIGLHFFKERAQRKAMRKVDDIQAARQKISLAYKASPPKSPHFLRPDDSPQDLEVSSLTFDSPVRSIIELKKNKTLPASESSFLSDVSKAQRIQRKMSQHNFFAQRGKNRVELLSDNGSVIELDKVILQEGNHQISGSLSNIESEKHEILHPFPDQSQNQSNQWNLLNHPNSIPFNSYIKLPSNVTDSPQNSPPKFNHDFSDRTLADSRVLDFSPDKDLLTKIDQL